MASIGYATLDVIPSFKGLQGQLDSGTSGPLKNAGTKGGTLFGDAAGRSAASRFGSVFRRGAKVAALGALAASAAAIKFGGDALEEAREAQKVGAQTDAVIKSTGKAAKVTAKDVGRLSGRLSDMAGIDDELIQSGANVLLTFKNIRNEAGKGNDIFTQATEAALDMSVALGTDLKGANVQLGKALNDPIKGMSTLGRAGVQFSEDQKEAIKKMVESGDVLGAQKTILKELEDQFKGSAKAQATEADKLNVAFGNLKEEVGTALIPVMDDLAVFLRKKGIPAAQDFFGWIQDDGIPAVKDFAEQTKPVIRVVKDLADVFADLPTAGKVASLGGALAGGLVIKHQFSKIFERGGIANPMFVTVTNSGGLPGGPAGGSAGSAIKRLALTGAVSIAVAGAATFSIKEISDALAGKETDAGRFGTPGGNSSPLIDGIDLDATAEDRKKYEEFLERARDKSAGWGRELDLVGSKKVEPKFAVPGLAQGREGLAEFIRLQIEAGKPITPYIHINGFERAMQQIATLQNAASAVPTAGVDNGATYQHGGTPGITPRAGVNFNGPINVQAHDYDDFTRQLERKSQRAGLGGRP